MSRKLDDLAPLFKLKAIELVARCSEAGIPVYIVDTLRTPEEHAANLARGVSWTARSKHLDGLAIDVVPYAQFSLHGPDKLEWNADDPAWRIIGKIGEGLGLRWGGRFACTQPHIHTKRCPKADFGHFEQK